MSSPTNLFASVPLLVSAACSSGSASSSSAGLAMLCVLGCSAEVTRDHIAPAGHPSASFASRPAHSTPVSGSPATAAPSAAPHLPPTASATSLLVGNGGGGKAFTCIGLQTDARPAPCPDASFCHRLSLADLTLSVASVTSKAPATTEQIVEHYRFVSRGPFGSAETDSLTACFRGEPPSRPLKASVRVELSASWGECPSDAVRVLKTNATKETTDCVRDTLKRVVLPAAGKGPARLVLDVSLSGLEPSN